MHVLVHLGLNKCGSTYLQHALHAARPRLIEAGTFYPEQSGPPCQYGLSRYYGFGPDAPGSSGQSCLGYRPAMSRATVAASSDISFTKMAIDAIKSQLGKLLYIALWGLGLLLISLIPVVNLIAPVLWVVFGAIFIGAVHDFGALMVSLRNRGQTVGQIAGRLISPRASFLFLVILFFAVFKLNIIGGIRVFNMQISLRKRDFNSGFI